MDPDARSVCVVAMYPPVPSETFIRAHLDRLPARTTLVSGWRASVDGRNVLGKPRLAMHKLRRMVLRRGLEAERTDAYLAVFREHRSEAVLAEYGVSGVWCAEACRRSGIPLIVHFHGFDASNRETLSELAQGYRDMFQTAAAVIGVSKAMIRALAELGAPLDRLHHVPCGVDVERFGGAQPDEAGPVFLAVGRFIDKKAPHHTIVAFSRVIKAVPSARLRMIGDGALHDACRILARELGVADAITFLGAQPHTVVEAEMKAARCFVQHSVVAESGDSEGTPVAIIEAGATGLPVIATRHAGIPDVVIEGETGLLVEEHDVEGMAAHMLRLATDGALAARLGAHARVRIREHYSSTQRIAQLWSIIESSVLEMKESATSGARDH